MGGCILPNPVHDQADGLRRLLGKGGLRVLRLNSGRRGMGKTSVAVNLAAAMVAKGREVLILDENATQGNVGDHLGQRARRDLLQVVRGECSLDQTIHRVAGISILAAARGLSELKQLPHDARLALGDALAKACPQYDVVIIDSMAGTGSVLLPLALAAQEELLVVSGSVAGITDAYAFIKATAGEYGKRRYRVLMSRIRNQPPAQAMFDNMAGAAQRYLGIELELMGMIPFDEKLKRASSLGQPLLAAFPDAPAAATFRQLGLAVTEWPRTADSNGDMSGFLHGLIRCAAVQLSGSEAGQGANSASAAARFEPRKGIQMRSAIDSRRGFQNSMGLQQGCVAV